MRYRVESAKPDHLETMLAVMHSNGWELHCLAPLSFVEVYGEGTSVTWFLATFTAPDLPRPAAKPAPKPKAVKS